MYKWYLHFGQDISNNLSVVIFSHIGELGPGQCMVEIILHLIVLWQTEQIAILHVEQILRLCVGRLLINDM